MKHKKYLSTLIALFFLISILFSIAFEAAEADHDCTGEGCSICMALEICDNILKTGCTAAAGAAVIAFAAAFEEAVSKYYSKRAAENTLISLKVRLDN